MNSEFAYLLATHALALVFAASALAKLIQSPGEAREAPSLLQRIAAAKWFPWLGLAVAIAFVLPLPALGHVPLAVFAAAVVTGGQWERLRRPADDCNCFGSITPESRLGSAAVALLACLAAVVVVAAAATSPLHAFGPNLWLLLATLLLAYVAARILRYDELTGNGYASKWVIETISSIPRALVFGREDGEEVTGEDIAALGKPVLVLVASSHCRDCLAIHRELGDRAPLLARHLTLVVIAEHKRMFSAGPLAEVAQLVDARSRVGRHLGAKSRPFMLYLTPDLRLKMPPVNGAENIHALFLLLEKAMEPSPGVTATPTEPAREPEHA